MSISLDKRTELATGAVLTLMKDAADQGVDLGEVSAEVILAVDYSGSMEHLYNNGSVQDVVERCLAMTLTGLDLDGIVPVYPFHSDVLARRDATIENYQGFVQREFTERMGGTNYVPVMNAIIGEVTGTAPAAASPRGRGLSRLRKQHIEAASTGPAETPTLVLFVTDGEPSDSQQAIEVIRQSANLPIFWEFIGIGMQPALLTQLDTMSGRMVDNVGFTEFNPRETDEAAQERWFREALREFILGDPGQSKPSWLAAARAQNIIT